MLILHNAKILETNLFTRTEALAIQDGNIIAVGNNEDIISLADRNSEIVDMHGKTILPGLTDAHIHFQQTGRNLSIVNCETDDVQECYQRLRAKASVTPPGNWIMGHGWNQNQWSGGYDDLNRLHEVSEEHPIFISAKSLHGAWVNKRALTMAGITRETPDPLDGVIGRDDEGHPNGLLFEFGMRLMDDLIPVFTGQTLVDNLNETQKELWKVGITAIHDFDGPECFSALQQLDEQRKLRLRVLKSIPLQNLEAAIQTGVRTGFGSDFIRVGPVKLFADGALGTQTAAMLEPYANDPENSGMLMLSQAEIVHYGKMAIENGLSLAIHAIGDLSNHIVINAYSEIRQLEHHYPNPALHHRIEHVQVLAEEDIIRLAPQQIVASMQPIHLVSDMDMADNLWGERSRYAYAFNSLIQSGTRLIFGSDAPVESFNPFLGIYAALTRSKFNQAEDKSWFPQEKISLQQILAAYTINPSIVSHWDGRIGNISAGKFADLIVLPVDPFEIAPQAFTELAPLATMVAGEWVWKEGEF